MKRDSCNFWTVTVFTLVLAFLLNMHSSFLHANALIIEEDGLVWTDLNGIYNDQGNCSINGCGGFLCGEACGNAIEPINGNITDGPVSPAGAVAGNWFASMTLTLDNTKKERADGSLTIPMSAELTINGTVLKECPVSEIGESIDCDTAVTVGGVSATYEFSSNLTWVRQGCDFNGGGFSSAATLMGLFSLKDAPAGANVPDSLLITLSIECGVSTIDNIDCPRSTENFPDSCVFTATISEFGSFDDGDACATFGCATKFMNFDIDISSPTQSEPPTPDIELDSGDPTPIEKPTSTPVVPSNTPEPIRDDIVTIDIHPIQVVQNPPGINREETIPLVAQKATMVRVFVQMPVVEIDGKIAENVVGQCTVAGTTESITADLWQFGKTTFVIPKNSPMEVAFNFANARDATIRQSGNFTKANNVGDLSKILALDSFNFFGGSGTVFPGQGKQTITFTLSKIPKRFISSGNSTIIEDFTFDKFLDTDGNSSFNLNFSFLETPDFRFTKTDGSGNRGPKAHTSLMNTLFEHTIAVYPIPRKMAKYSISPNIISKDASAPSRIQFARKEVASELAKKFSNKGIDRYLVIVSGKKESGKEISLITKETSTIDKIAHGFYDNNIPDFVWVDTFSGAFAVAHELGHSYLFKHNKEKSGDGWDPRLVSTGNVIKFEDKHISLMNAPTVNSKTWISYDEYNKLYSKFVKGEATPPKMVKPSKNRSFTKGTEKILIVSGAITFSGEYIPFPYFQVPGKTDDGNVSDGDDYSIIIRSKFGNELSRVDFDANFSAFGDSEEIVSPFIFTLPFPQFAKRANVIEFVKNGKVIETRKISRKQPSISVIDIRPIDSTTFAVDLSVSDKDGDVLDYAVTYTPHGEMFFDIDFEWIEQDRSFQFDLSGLPEGSDEGRINVFVTDGVRTANASSNTFVVPNREPTASILQPMENSVFESESIIHLTGSEMDPEDGTLPDTSLAWRSDIDGALGEGRLLEVLASELSPGSHNIEFAATDSKGAEIITSIPITVVETAIPDAMVQSINFNTPFPSVGDEITIEVSIVNFGKNSFGTISFYNGDPATGGSLISSSEELLSV